MKWKESGMEMEREIKTFINENVSEINNNYNSVMEKIFKDITDKFNLEINKHIPNDNIEKYTTSSASYNNKNKLYRMNSNMMENNSYLNYKE